jgi:peptide-methionine (S)-S-oxide reductase
MATATFAAGCFWGVEARFAALPGVRATEVGYTGGTSTSPTYRQVCSHETGHAEAVRLEYDPAVLTYEQLLDEFFAMHDPTTRDRQGPDVGSQYRSAIFFHTPEQERAAREAVRSQDESGRWPRPVVTQVAPAGAWWRAEDYHQKYAAKHGRLRESSPAGRAWRAFVAPAAVSS